MRHLATEMDVPVSVYVIARKSDSGIGGPVKVGLSKSPLSRLRNLQTACPFEIELVYEFDCPTREAAEYLERSFHATQKKKMLYGEWFDYGPIEAIYILCIGYRIMLENTFSDRRLYKPILEYAGVLWAEQRFGLHFPTESAQ